MLPEAVPTDFSATQFTIVLSGVVSALSVVLTLIFTKGMDAYAKYRAERRIDGQIEDKREISGFEFVISDLRTRLEKTESRLGLVEAEHLTCIKNHERLAAENLSLHRDIKRLETEIEELRTELSK